MRSLANRAKLLLNSVFGKGYEVGWFENSCRLDLIYLYSSKMIVISLRACL